MRISVCITVKDESVVDLLKALANQTKLPDEVVVVDASTILNLKFEILNQFTNLNIKLIKRKNISRSRGRNLAVKMARNEIIAMTDAGCIPHKDWLEKITTPYNKVHPRGVQVVVAGFYTMSYSNELQKAMRVYLGVLPNKFDKKKFLPSTRSIAFTKSVWKKVGGFPEKDHNSSEDTDFNYKLLAQGIKFIRVKKAVADWAMPKSLREFAGKIYNYARWDAEESLLTPHNLHSLFVVFRSLLAFSFLAFIFWNDWKFVNWYIFAFIGTYLLYAFNKVGLWGLILQPTADLGAIIGYGSGIIKKFFVRVFLDG